MTRPGVGVVLHGHLQYGGLNEDSSTGGGGHRVFNVMIQNAFVDIVFVCVFLPQKMCGKQKAIRSYPLVICYIAIEHDHL
jgi:hypothetical protein